MVLVATQPLLLVVNPSVQVKSVGDLIGMAQKNPGSMTYGLIRQRQCGASRRRILQDASPGSTSSTFPTRAAALRSMDLVGGQIDLMFDVFSTAAPLAKTGKLRPIAITSAKRSEQFPDVPTMQQAGVEGFEAGTWFGVLAPAGTPEPIVAKLSATTNEVLKEAEVRDTLASQGAEVKGGTPAEFTRFFHAEYEKWGKVVKAAGVVAN